MRNTTITRLPRSIATAFPSATRGRCVHERDRRFESVSLLRGAIFANLIPRPGRITGNRRFESSSLQRRVVRTMVTAATWSRTAASVSRLSLVSCFQVTSTPWGSDSSATGATPTLPTSASKATAFHVWLRRSVPDAEHLMRCPSRMAENTATRRFCAQCGTPLPSPCPSCGFENEPSARFCGGCGKPLGKTAVPVPRVAPASPAHR